MSVLKLQDERRVVSEPDALGIAACHGAASAAMVVQMTAPLLTQHQPTQLIRELQGAMGCVLLPGTSCALPQFRDMQHLSTGRESSPV